MRSLKHTQTLMYYDGPELIEARDQIGGYWIVMLVENRETDDLFIAAGVAPEQLQLFKSGRLDLKTLFLCRPIPEWFLTSSIGDLNEPFLLEPASGDLEKSGYLPDDDLFLHVVTSDDSVIQESRKRNNLILELSVDPPEAATEHRIATFKLAGLISGMDSLLKKAYTVGMNRLDRKSKNSMNKDVPVTEGPGFDVIIPAKAGSFRIVLEAISHPNLFHESEAARALLLIDELFSNPSDIRAAIEKVKGSKALGHAYFNFLKFLIKSNTGFSYSWAEPSFVSARRGKISHSEAIPLAEALSNSELRQSLPRQLTGVVESADQNSGEWGLRSGRERFKGKIAEGGQSLAGLTIGSIYIFDCLETVEWVEAFDDTITRYSLRSYAPA